MTPLMPTVYTFEDDEGPVGSFTTQDFGEAQDYASRNSLAIIEHEYVLVDSHIVEDYRPLNGGAAGTAD